MSSGPVHDPGGRMTNNNPGGAPKAAVIGEHRPIERKKTTPLKEMTGWMVSGQGREDPG